METIIMGEPTTRQLQSIYDENLTHSIRIGNLTGQITNRGGGWGEPAIEINFPGISAIIARERESEDYEDKQEQPDELEIYNWQYEDEDNTYYRTIADAIGHSDSTNRAM